MSTHMHPRYIYNCCPIAWDLKLEMQNQSVKIFYFLQLYLLGYRFG